MKKLRSGFTLIEIVMTLIVFISLCMMAVFTLTNYMPKHRLLDSVETMEITLSRAQIEATSRSSWTCISFASLTNTLSVFVDSDAPFHGSVSSCGFGNDLPITSIQLRSGVTFAAPSGSGCSGGGETAWNFSPTSEMWFNSTGIPQDCTGGSCIPRSFSFVLTNSQLDSSNRAREVEALSSGMIAIVPRGVVGYMPGFGARTAALSAGCE